MIEKAEQGQWNLESDEKLLNQMKNVSQVHISFISKGISRSIINFFFSNCLQNISKNRN